MLLYPSLLASNSHLPGWESIGPPHKQRYMRYSGPYDVLLDPEGQENDPKDATATAGELLASVRSRLFGSAAFGRLLHAMLDVELLAQAGEVRRFRAGEMIAAAALHSRMAVWVHPGLPQITAKPSRVPGSACIDFNLSSHRVSWAAS